jgi:hypothetical protein
VTYKPKRPDNVYIREDWNAGDRDVRVSCHRQWIATNAKTQKCLGNGPGQAHDVPRGERMLVQSACIEGHWGGYRLCLRCCDVWLDDVAPLEDAK